MLQVTSAAAIILSSTVARNLEYKFCKRMDYKIFFQGIGIQTLWISLDLSILQKMVPTWAV